MRLSTGMLLVLSFVCMEGCKRASTSDASASQPAASASIRSNSEYASGIVGLEFSKAGAPLPAEAVKELQVEWHKHFVSWGDSWAAQDRRSHSILYFKSPLEARITSAEVSEVDKLNGLEWRGVALIVPTASRELRGGTGEQGTDSPEQKWGLWRDDTCVCFQVFKLNGRWIFSNWHFVDHIDAQFISPTISLEGLLSTMNEESHVHGNAEEILKVLSTNPPLAKK